MNEDALRAIVRETLAQLDARSSLVQRGSEPVPLLMHNIPSHASHYRYSSLPSSGGPCNVEPGIPCHHCGYCESHGH